MGEQPYDVLIVSGINDAGITRDLAGCGGSVRLELGRSEAVDVLPYEADCTVIGTADVEIQGDLSRRSELGPHHTHAQRHNVATRMAPPQHRATACS